MKSKSTEPLFLINFISRTQLIQLPPAPQMSVHEKGAQNISDAHQFQLNWDYNRCAVRFCTKWPGCGVECDGDII